MSLVGGGLHLPLKESVRVTVHKAESTFIGVIFADSDALPPMIQTVHPGSVAEKAGIRPGDVLRSVNGIKPHSATHAVRELVAAGGDVEIVLNGLGDWQEAVRADRDDSEPSTAEASSARSMKSDRSLTVKRHLPDFKQGLVSPKSKGATELSADGQLLTPKRMLPKLEA